MSKNMDEHLLEKMDEIEATHWWWEGRRQLVRMLMGRKKYSRILDIGSGTGEMITYLKKIYPKSEFFGMDTSVLAIDYAKKRGHKNITKASATKLLYKNNYFDAVIVLDVLEHIKNDGKCITEAGRVLKKGGKLIITSPGLSFIWSKYDINQGHQRRYTRRRFIKLAKESNLKVEYISYFNFLLSPPIIIIRLLSKIKRLQGLSSYDNSINLDIAKVGTINTLLKNIFLIEIRALQYIKYPFGISIVAVLSK